MFVYGKYECFVMQMLYVCVLCASCGSSQCCILHELSLLMLVEDARGDHMEETYSRAGLLTALLVAISVSFCLPHPVAVSAFMICRGLCACTEMLWMYVMYVSFGSKVRPRTFGCVAMGSALLCPDCSYILQGLAEQNVSCFVQAKTFCRYGCIYFLASLVCVCVWI